MADEKGYPKVRNYIIQSSKEPYDQVEQDLYDKDPGAAKTEGHSYEVKLAMLFLLSGKEESEKGKISNFRLATDMKKVTGFDDIVFQYEEGGRSKIIFLQAKHREKDTDVTENTLLSGSGKDFDLSKYFGAYTKIKQRFSSEKVEDPIFGEEFQDVDCSFIIFTNALPRFSDKNIQKEIDQEDVLNIEKSNYYYKLSSSDEIDKAILKDHDSSKKDEVKEFLSKLKLFFGQPNQKELGEIIKKKIQSSYSVEQNDIDQVFASVQDKVQEWHRKKGKVEFLKKENRFLEDSARVSIKFDVKEPVTLFTGRIKELKDLHKILQDKGGVVISQMASVTGLGGIGKSELARKYISEHNREYDGNVIWINADNYLTIAESFRRLAKDKLKISTTDENGKEKDIKFIIPKVYDFFAERHRRSLFVFDNAGKHKTHGEKDEGIDKFLPFGPDKPYVLITSRDQEWGNIKSLPLGVFTEEEAVEFIGKALKDVIKLEESEIKRLAEKLQYLPLALEQAVAYIKMENKESNKWGEGKFTIDNYLEQFRKKANKLLGKAIDRYTQTVLTTWQVTIEKIKQKKVRGGVQALEILDVIAYLAPDKIPIDEMFSKLISDEEVRHGAVDLLDQYSMANLEHGKLNIHRLVQQVTRIELEGQGENKEVIKKTFGLLGASFPYGSDKSEDYPKKRQLLPHLETFLSHIDDWIAKSSKNKQKVEEDYLEDLLTWMGDGYFDLGNPGRQKDLLERALPILKAHYGSGHLATAQMLGNLGNAYRALGNPQRAKDWLDQALEIKRNHYDSNNLELAITLENLGIVYGDLGDYQKKKKFLEQALSIFEGHHEPNHLEVARILQNLGNAYDANYGLERE